MKILAINGSPRGKKSTTYMMIEEFLKGTRRAGWSDQHILLSEMNIHHCMGCFHCWRNQGICIFNDDMKKLPILDCDILLLASPLFVDNVTGLMKNYLDRSVFRAHPHIGHDKHGECIHIKKSSSRPKLLVMANCGYPEQTHFEALKLLFRRMARNRDTELIGEIYRGQGPLLLNDDPRLKSIIDEYKALLQTAGSEIAQNLSISVETQKKLEEPLIPFEQYIKRHNAIFTHS